MEASKLVLYGTQLHASDYVTSGVPCIMPQDIIDGKISTGKISYISEENANRLSNFRLAQNDIIYPRRGDITKHALITSRENGWLCGTGCLRISCQVVRRHWDDVAWAIPRYASLFSSVCRETE